MASDSFRSAAPQSSLAVRVPCSADDNFASVWPKLIPRFVSESDLLPPDVRDALNPAVGLAEDILAADELTPESVARVLHVLSSQLPLLVILDEFDRIGDFGSTQLFADLVKTISDDLLRCTIAIVGVADDVDGLISSHQSVERSLRQIPLRRMSPEEITEVVVGGFDTFEHRTGVKINIPPRVVSYITQMSQGFPHYAHLLAGSIGEVALRKSVTSVNQAVLAEALNRALNEAQQSIRSNYTAAVSSPIRTAQFAPTLLACALAEVDELNFFAPADVSEPLSQLLGSHKKTADFLHRLHKFTDDPSWILETRGVGRRTRYRFSNPLMRPFILIKGMRDGFLEIKGSEIKAKKPRPGGRQHPQIATKPQPSGP